MSRVELTHLAPPTTTRPAPLRPPWAGEINGVPRPLRRAPSHFEPLPPSSWVAEHSLYTPLHYEPKYAYPLLVWLHDQGEDENDLLARIPQLSLRNYAAVGPRGCDSCVVGGFAWIQSGGAIARAEQAVFAAIDAARLHLNVHPDRIYLVGAGAGGTMAFRLAFRHPELFAGVVSLNGPLPDGLAPLACLKACRRLPILWTHSAAGEFADAALAAQLKLLYTAGFDLTLRQYPSADPDWDLLLPDANRWIMDRLADSVVR